MVVRFCYELLKTEAINLAVEPQKKLPIIRNIIEILKIIVFDLKLNTIFI